MNALSSPARPYRTPAAPPADRRRPGLTASSALRAGLPDDHPIAMLMDEHRTLLAHVERLSALCAEPTPPARRGELVEIAWLSDRLAAAELHHRREEQVLLPALAERGADCPPETLAGEHAALRELALRLQALAHRMLEEDVWRELTAAAAAFAAMLEADVAREDGILYPLALRVIRKPEEWRALRRRCDAIGYCCPLRGLRAEARGRGGRA